jgi:hypothetical protein
MKTITQLEYFGSKFIDGLCKKSTIDLYKETTVKGNRICLVKKTNFGIDYFFKNGKLKYFMDFKSFDEAQKQYDKIVKR